MMLPDTTADLLDSIFNRGLVPIPYSGRGMYGAHCVATIVGRGGDLEDLRKAGATVDHMGLDYVVYWPDIQWDANVQEYVATIQDPSAGSDH